MLWTASDMSIFVPTNHVKGQILLRLRWQRARTPGDKSGDVDPHASPPFDGLGLRIHWFYLFPTSAHHAQTYPPTGAACRVLFPLCFSVCRFRYGRV